MVDKKKYKSIILYFASKINNGTLGKVKLMKLLYYLDFDYFEKYRKSVTGDEYIRMPLGPVPSHGEEILNEMKKGGEVKIKRVEMPQGMSDQNLISAVKPLDLSPLSKEEIFMLGETCDKWEKFSGNEMKNASHGDPPWIGTKPNSIIDYNLVFYRNKYKEMERV